MNRGKSTEMHSSLFVKLDSRGNVLFDAGPGPPGVSIHLPLTLGISRWKSLKQAALLCSTTKNESNSSPMGPLGEVFIKSYSWKETQKLFKCIFLLQHA